MGSLIDVSHDAGEDSLRLAPRANSVAELLAVSRVDLAATVNDRRAGVHVEDLPRHDAVGGRRARCS